VTETAFAAKVVVPDPPGTVTPAGTVRFVLLLERATLKPVAGAAPLNEIVQETGPEPLTDPGEHTRLVMLAPAEDCCIET
jgi:hypothetical protein